MSETLFGDTGDTGGGGGPRGPGASALGQGPERPDRQREHDPDEIADEEHSRDVAVGAREQDAPDDELHEQDHLGAFVNIIPQVNSHGLLERR